MSPSSMDIYATMSLRENSWDYHDFMVCVNLLAEGDVFYDVGANVGYMTLEMAAISRDGIHVVGFEPHSDLASAIRSSISLNDYQNVELVEAMVGDESKTADFFVAPATIHSSAVSDSGRPHVSVTSKPMVTIDDLVGDGSIAPPSAVKMDVEGSEHLVFRGAHETFRSHKPHIFAEYHSHEDPGGRIRAEMKSLAEETRAYRMYLRPRGNARKNYDFEFVRWRSDEELEDKNSVIMRSMDRPVRDEAVFEPW